jgi:hypothetical protein
MDPLPATLEEFAAECLDSFFSPPALDLFHEMAMA